MEKTNKPNKSFKIVITIVVLLITILLIRLYVKNIGYEDGLERKSPIKGTYIIDDNNKNSTYLSIDYGEGINEFYYFRADNQIIKSGAVKKNNENYYILYDKATNAVYGKIIPSYKKIYLVDKDLNIVELEYYTQPLIYPALK